MNTLKENNSSSLIKKNYNPKAHSPAVYIPCWLIQVPTQFLTYGAKLLYGRLSQWSNSKGQVYRSVDNLCKELGMSRSPVERFLKELRDCELIGTYQPVKGGVNHFQFYDHPWMHEDLNEELEYKSDPPPCVSIPPTYPGGTPHLDRCDPPPTQVDINIKEIKRNNLYKEIYKEKSDEALSSNKKTTKASPSSVSKKVLSLSQLLEDNPHNLDEELIEDWIEVRKNKKAAITRTAWKGINNELSKCKVNPIEAFKEAVERGWTSFKSEWLENKKDSNYEKTRYQTWDEITEGKTFDFSGELYE